MKGFLLSAALFAVVAATLSGDVVDCGNVGQILPVDDCLGDVGANPINPAMGNLHREVTDLETYGFAPVSFARIYNSRTTNFNSAYWDFGYKQTWQHNWNYEVRDLNAKTHGIRDVKVRYPSGREYNFRAADASCAVRVPTAEQGDRLYPWGGSTVGFTLVSPDGRELDFQRTRSPKYQLVEARDGQGVALRLFYDPDGRLQRIENPFGRWIEIERGLVDGALCITKVRSHDGREVSYDYEAWTPTDSVVLSEVGYPGGESARYSYVGASSESDGRPLLGSASDPMYGGVGARVRYVYNYDMVFDFGGGPYLITGVAKEERSLVTDAPIVSLPLGTGPDVPVIEASGAEVRRRFANGLIAEQVDGEGNVIAFSRSAGGYGYIESRADASGGVTHFERDFAGRVTRETDAEGGVTQTYYNEAGFVVSEIDALGRSTTTTRDAHNRPVRIDYPDGSYEEWNYNGFGQPLAHRRPDGGTVSYSYYAAGEPGGFPQDLKLRTDAEGQSESYTYNEAGLRVSKQDRRGRLTDYAYDWRGQLVATTHADGSMSRQLWDEWGNRIAKIDELGQTTVYTYDEYNRRDSRTDPLGRVTLYEYGAQPGCGSCGYLPTLARETLPSGREVVHYYDNRGKRIETVLAPGTPSEASTRFEYDAVGNLVARVDPLGRETRWSYDALGRRLSRTNPLGETTEWNYDAVGNVLEVARFGRGTLHFEYDARDRLTRSVDEMGAVTERVYDEGGRIAEAIDPLGRTVERRYDLEGRLQEETYPDGNRKHFQYDQAGNLVGVIDEMGGLTQFAYDARGRLVRETDPLGRSHATVYDAAGRVVEEISPMGRRVEYQYDEAGQLVSKIEGAGSPEEAATEFLYDLDGALRSVIDAAGRITLYDYDSLGRKASELDPLYNMTEYRYDAVGNQIETALPDGSVIVRGYDALDRLIEETDAAGRSTSYAYGPSGELESITDARGATTWLDRDPTGRLLEKRFPDGRGERMEYDAAGQLRRQTSASGVIRPKGGSRTKKSS